MRKIKFIYLCLFAVMNLNSCNDADTPNDKVKRSPRIRKAVKLDTPSKNLNYTLGEDILFEVSHRDEISIDSVRLEIGPESILEEGNQISWVASRTGSPSIKLFAYYEGEVESLYPRVSIKPSEEPEQYTYRVISEYPHDEDAYTQGLFFLGDTLIESTGNESSSGSNGSSIRKTLYQNGEILQIVNLEDKYFGEGCTIWENKIYQLTWTSRKAFVYDRKLNKLNTFNYTTEGWGITTYQNKLFMTDGSENIYILNPGDFSRIDKLEAFDINGKVDQLNELEIIDGLLYANIYGEDKIVAIDPMTGAVVKEIDFSGIIDRRRYRGFDYAMNGIAYKKDEKRVFVTGKWWPTLFEVLFIPKPNNS